MKNPNDPIGNQTRETFRLVAQCLNELRHRVPRFFCSVLKIRDESSLQYNYFTQIIHSLHEK